MSLADLKLIDFDDLRVFSEQEKSGAELEPGEKFRDTNRTFEGAAETESLGDITNLQAGIAGTLSGQFGDIDIYYFTVDTPTQFNAILDIDPEFQDKVNLQLLTDFNNDGIVNSGIPGNGFPDLLKGTAFRGIDEIEFDQLTLGSGTIVGEDIVFEPGEYFFRVLSQTSVDEEVDYQIKFETPEIETAQLNLELRNIISEDALRLGQEPVRFEVEIGDQIFEQSFNVDFEKTTLTADIDPAAKQVPIKIRAFSLNGDGSDFAQLDLDRRRGDLEFDATYDVLSSKLFKPGAGIEINEEQGFAQTARGDEQRIGDQQIRDGFLSLRVIYDTTASIQAPDRPVSPTPEPNADIRIVGTEGNDELDGNELDNQILGLEGSDTVNGNAGDDIIQATGNPTNPNSVGKGEIDRLNGGAGKDAFVLHTNNGMTVLYDAGNNRNPGKKDFAIIEDFNKNQDRIELAGSRNEYFIGRSNVRKIADGRAIFRDTDGDGRLRKGRDELIAVVEGVNQLSLDDLDFVDIPVTVGSNRAERLQGTGKDGIIHGRGGRDTINAKGGDDIVLGGNGNDVLNGGRGDDLLDGGKGNDKYRGNSGADVFVIAPNQGSDKILDFEDGEDLFGLAKGLTFEDLSFQQRGNTTIITFELEKLAVVKGVDTTHFGEDDFVSIGYERFEGMKVPVALGLQPTVS